MKPRSNRGFTLLELLVVTLITLTILASLVAYKAREREIALCEAEDKNLLALKADIESSGESEDYANVNVLALSGALPAGTTPTAFSQHNCSGILPNVAVEDWYAKVARQHGLPVTYGAAPDQATQPELYRIAYNDYGRPRALYAAPAETDRQRFALVSVMGRDTQYVVPAFANTEAWFDAIFGTTWNTQQATLPALWKASLSASQISSWSGGVSGSNMWRLRIVPITIDKKALHINNGSTDNTLIVVTDGGATVYNVPPGTTVTTDPILIGRTVNVYLNAVSGSPDKTFSMSKKSDIIYQ